MSIELITSLVVVMVCFVYAIIGVKDIQSIINRERKIREVNPNRFHI